MRRNGAELLQAASCTFPVTDTADDMATGGDRQLSVRAGGQEAGVAADPVRHLETCRKMEVRGSRGASVSRLR